MAMSERPPEAWLTPDRLESFETRSADIAADPGLWRI